MNNDNLNLKIDEHKLTDIENFNKIVLESSPDCLKILDTNGRLQYMNFNGLCQMEIDDFSIFKDQLWWDLWGKENENLVREAVQTALKGNATQFSAFCATAKGTPKWWHVTITPVGSPTNGIYQLLSVSRDITAQKQAEEEIINLNNLLEEKVKIRTEELLEKNIELERKNSELAIFNRIASHDLQEPLRKIQIFSNLIMQSDKEAKEINYNFSRIIDATERMRNLIDSLKQFALSKNSAITFEICNLNEILSDVIEYSQHAIDEGETTITVEELPEINGSKVLITQLFVNLLENALKYRKSEVPLQVLVSSEMIDSQQLSFPIKNDVKQFHAIKMQDNGIGFSDEFRNQIFDAFKRLHSKDDFSGSGIGLAICKSITQNHNGYIEATGNLNSGSTFTIYFPKE